MAQIDHIKTVIKTLSYEDFAHLREWIAEKDWQDWDKQIEKDVASGKLDFLRDEAVAAKKDGQLRKL